MKAHRILKDFKGSQTGHDHHEFKAGTVRPLSADLARIAVKEGWAVLHTEPTAEDRDTKIITPDEFKAPDESTEAEQTAVKKSAKKAKG